MLNCYLIWVNIHFFTCTCTRVSAENVVNTNAAIMLFTQNCFNDIMAFFDVIIVLIWS